jgi:putative membrane protein
MKNFRTLVSCAVVCSAILAGQAMAQTKTKLTDPEIASVAVIANQVDMGYAEVAKERSKDAEVLKFADAMASDHKSVIDQAVALVTKLGVTPKENAAGKKLQADAEAEKKVLRAAPEKEFNKMYIDNEVAYHKAVIKVVEGTLLPEASNPELKALLAKVVPILKAHLGHAEMVQKMFAKK